MTAGVLGDTPASGRRSWHAGHQRGVEPFFFPGTISRMLSGRTLLYRRPSWPWRSLLRVEGFASRRRTPATGGRCMPAARLEPDLCGIDTRRGCRASVSHAFLRFVDLSSAMGLAFPRTSGCAFAREGPRLVSARMSCAAGPGCRWLARRDRQQPAHRAEPEWRRVQRDWLLAEIVGGCFYLHAPENPKSGHYLCPPGDPMVSSMGSNLGSAGGGTVVQIHGENLGWVTGVFGPGS